MSRIWRIISAIVLVALILVGVRLAIAFNRFSRVERQFASVEMGQSRNAVLAKLVRPNYHEGSCGVIHFPDKNCATEYVYAHPFAPWIPEYYIVAFSSDDRVIEANKWTSP